MEVATGFAHDVTVALYLSDDDRSTSATVRSQAIR